jgi:hypothetical protein
MAKTKAKDWRRSRWEDRKREAQERQAARDKLSDEAQIAVLDARLGPGIGALKERLRLGDSRAEEIQEELYR